MRPFRYCFLIVHHESGWFPRLESPDSGMSRDFLCGAAGRAVWGRGPCSRVRVCLRGLSCLRGRLCLRAGTSDRCAPAVLSLPPLRGGPLTVHEATGGYAVRSPCPSGIPRPRHNAPPLGCRDYSGFDLCAASIRKFGLEIKNRCTVCPCFDLFAASIRKSGPEIENRCTVCPCFGLLAASISKSGPEIRNHCSAIVPASRMARLQQSLPPRCRVRFYFSLPHSRTVPPAEGRYRYDAASDSNFRRSKVERSACVRSLLQS